MCAEGPKIADHWVKLGARSPTQPMRRYSHAAQNKDSSHAPNAFRQYPAAVVSRLGERLRPWVALGARVTSG
jgi:uncharacterized protein YjbJ (UPF0337 family)